MFTLKKLREALLITVSYDVLNKVYLMNTIAANKARQNDDRDG